MNDKKKIEILKRCQFLVNVRHELLAALADELSVLRVTKGETVVTKGDHGSTMYFIATGKVQVHDGKVVLARLNEGEIFGEMAVLDADVRSASVSAEEDSTLFGLERDVLWRIVSQSPKALKSIIAFVM